MKVRRLRTGCQTHELEQSLDTGLLCQETDQLTGIEVHGDNFVTDEEKEKRMK